MHEGCKMLVLNCSTKLQILEHKLLSNFPESLKVMQINVDFIYGLESLNNQGVSFREMMEYRFLLLDLNLYLSSMQKYSWGLFFVFLKRWMVCILLLNKNAFYIYISTPRTTFKLA